jgi:hypothetical protein
MTLIASRSFIARHPSGTSSSRTTRSKSRPGSPHAEKVVESTHARTGNPEAR